MADPWYAVRSRHLYMLQVFPGSTWDGLWRLPLIVWLDMARFVDQRISESRSS
jgi:hypothetical protein